MRESQALVDRKGLHQSSSFTDHKVDRLPIPSNITKLNNQILDWHIFRNVLKTPHLAHIVSKNLDILRSITHPATRIIMIKIKWGVKHYCIWYDLISDTSFQGNKQRGQWPARCQQHPGPPLWELSLERRTSSLAFFKKPRVLDNLVIIRVYLPPMMAILSMNLVLKRL